MSVFFNHFLQGLLLHAPTLERSQGNGERPTDQSPLRSSITLKETDHMLLASYTCSHLWPLPLYFLDWFPSQLPIKCWQSKSLALDHLLA